MSENYFSKWRNIDMERTYTDEYVNPNLDAQPESPPPATVSASVEPPVTLSPTVDTSPTLSPTVDTSPTLSASVETSPAEDSAIKKAAEFYLASGLYQNAYHPNVNPEEIDVSVRNTVYCRESAGGEKEAVDITPTDNIFLTCPKVNGTRWSLDPDFLILAEKRDGAPGMPRAFGKLIPREIRKSGYNQDCYFLEIPGKTFRNPYAGEYFLIVRDASLASVLYAKEIRLNALPLPPTDNALCIDFGASNTTAGFYEGQLIKLVSFTTENGEESCLFPTLAYVRRQGRPDAPPEILFGYEARKVLLESEYNPKGSFFFEIKPWIAQNLNKEEEVTDEDGRVFSMRRSEIIAAYLRHVVRIAEIKLKRRFRTLHFSAPVKLKSRFIRFLRESVFPDESGYAVMPDAESLDEGMAIIYHYISELKKEFIAETDSEPEEGQIMIIDCGGGTTDVASCKYRFEKQDTGIKTELVTKFENGNSQYGGNNLTWRIFELLKIKLAHYYRNGGAADGPLVVSVDTLMRSDKDFLEEVDECVREGKAPQLYKTLDDECKRSEEILPTCFGDAETAREKENIRRNFNVLWEMAEKIKIAFYSSNQLAFVNFSQNPGKQIGVKSDAARLLYVRPQANRREARSAPDIEMNAREVDALLRPDIYYLLASLFTAPDGKELELGKRRITPEGKEIKIQFHLSGQSCRMGLFRELLKEFVPGRDTRTGASGGASGYSQSDKMKLECVEGCIRYVMERSSGAVIPEIRAEAPNIPYQVLIDRGQNTPKIPLIDGSGISATDEGVSCLPRAHLEQREPRPGIVHLTIVSLFGKAEKDRYEEEAPLRLTPGGAYAHESAPERKSPDAPERDSLEALCERIRQNSLRGIEHYRLSGDPGETALERFQLDMEEIPCDSVGKLVIFAFPNNAGYGYTLYQVLKKRNPDGREVYVLTDARDGYYERIDRKSVFDGKSETQETERSKAGGEAHVAGL